MSAHAAATASWIVIATSSAAFASGWNDYSLNIGEGYRVVRCNSLDILLACEKGMIITPMDYEGVGPIVGYAMTPEFIFTKHAGRSSGKHPSGVTYEEVDRSREFFFLVAKKDNAVTGPLTKREFEGHPLVKKGSAISWTKPRNPNIVRPLLGSAMFLLVAIPILAVKYWWVSLPVLFVLLSLGHGAKKGSRQV